MASKEKHADTKSERQTEARALVQKQFKTSNSRRKWKRSETTTDYIRYECQQSFCNSKSSDCWHVSLHVHSRDQSHFDRLYVFSLKKGRKAFMGTVSKVGLWRKRGNGFVRKQRLRRPQCKSFCRNYDFRGRQTVIIEQIANKYSIRLNPRSEGNVDAEGVMGKWSRWRVEPMNRGRDIRLKSEKTGKYLRMSSRNRIDARGDGRRSSDQWRVKRRGSYVLLENKRYKGRMSMLYWQR